MGAKTSIPELVELIYDAAENPQLWPDFLEALSQRLRSKMTVLYYQDFNRSSAW